jgi:hypothetical protein
MFQKLTKEPTITLQVKSKGNNLDLDFFGAYEDVNNVPGQKDESAETS